VFLEESDTVQRYLVIGATSAIAQACCRQWITNQQGEVGDSSAKFFLVGRSAEKLNVIADDLRARGAEAVDWSATDLSDAAAHSALMDNAAAKLGSIDVVLVAHGTLPDQTKCQGDADLAIREFWINSVVTIGLLTRAADFLSKQGHGVLAVITSVAGDRGRPSNYLYGSAKAAVSTFCEGLRARLYRKGVHVIDIRPGFVDTPMTQGLNLPRPLVSTPDRVARDIVVGILKRKDVLYVPRYWAIILWVIANIPAPIFKRMSL
jgi:decaprenylphospho-beta-D-erythro-pentofuranosid-2-ulose 2-reductase